MTIDPKYLHSDISDSVLKAFFAVRDSLPYDLEVGVYKRALELEMKSMGLAVEPDKEVNIIFKDTNIGSFFIDFVVNDSIIILVIKNDLSCEHQVPNAKNQLRLTKYEVCLILNFSADTLKQFSRILLTKEFKKDK